MPKSGNFSPAFLGSLTPATTKVLNPPSLRDKVIEELKKSLENY